MKHAENVARCGHFGNSYARQGISEILDVFLQSGVSREKIEKFLVGEPRNGTGAICEQIAADISNQ